MAWAMVATMMGLSAGTSALSSSRGWKNWRTQRKRININLAYGRKLYETQGIDPALGQFYGMTQRARELTAQRQMILGDAKRGAFADIEATGAQQLAAARSSVGNTPGTYLSQLQRGIYSDVGRSKAGVHGRFGAMQEQALGQSGSVELGAQQALAGALLTTGAAKYRMWQDQANVWMQAPQQGGGGLDLGGFAALFGAMKGMGGGGKKTTTPAGVDPAWMHPGSNYG